MRHASAPCKATHKQLPRDAWQLRVHDQDPASMSWETSVKIRARRTDNDAEYDRHQTRGIPRAGAARLHGLRYGGECGQKMMVQDTGGTHDRCNALRPKYGVPVCHNMPADGIDAAVVDTFFQALSPIELDIYARAGAAQRHADEQTEHARPRPRARLRSQAALAPRHYHRGDADNRMVAAARKARGAAA